MAEFVVTTQSDIVDPVSLELSLREAIALAQGPADTIRFDPSVSLITLNPALGPLTISSGQNITIIGDLGGAFFLADGRPNVFIGGANATRLFNVEANATLVLDTLLLENSFDLGEDGLSGEDGTTGTLPFDSGENGGPGGSGGTGEFASNR